MSPNNTRLQGRTALITGSTGGLGVAIAQAFARAGAFVVASGRNEQRGHDVVADIRSSEGAATFVVTDLAGGDGTAHDLVERATRTAGGSRGLPGV
jgi:NAD(P)-dependent dehydrogenase (short-subunit alcohol dehydrogenase family)